MLTAPRLITQVETRPAYEQDHRATLLAIQDQLTKASLCPSEHIVDAGYVSPKVMLRSKADYDVILVGPVHADPSWQARTPCAYDIARFSVDWQTQVVTCPEGNRNQHWYPAADSQGEPIIQVLFPASVCQPCLNRSRCTRAKAGGRTIVLRAEGRHAMLQTARAYQRTDAFTQTYRLRNGIEGTLSQALRNSGLRQSRYIGMPKTHLQSIATAVATNILRAIHWLNDVSLAPTRQSRFSALAAPS